ncbi:MAG: 4Fe-4S dicluster domain-containing protein [Leptospiraceae bacterium]|nr:4Fe-4S dicluster domain-containing protein [Leptospiraceae bacterium]
MIDRKDFFKKGIKSIFKTVKETKEVVSAVPEVIKESFTEKTTEDEEKMALNRIPQYTRKKHVTRNLFFLPGALSPPEKFYAKCTSCGDCIHICPYDAVFPFFDPKKNKSFPYLDPNSKACMLCKDYPCIDACKVGALKKLKKQQPKIGKAKLNFEFCLNHSGEEVCHTCEEVCPVDSAISIQSGKPKITAKCVGCGICVQSCPTFPKALFVK